jgi:hypothetical protein
LPVPAGRITPETFVAVFVSASAAVMAAAYLTDAIGLSIHPVALGVVAAGAAVAAFSACRETSATPPGSLPLFAGVVGGWFAYVMWLASPSLLPVTDGPDVVHHLLLMHVIQRTHHLVHDPSLEPYLLEMVNYTPGSHILAVAIAGWLRVDPLRVIFPLTAASVAMKAGIVYVLAVRVIPATRVAALHALAAPVLLLVPSAYVLGSFFQFYFYAQVVSETFAIAMVLFATSWMRSRDLRHLWLASVCGVGVFLSWPPWILPACIAVLAAILAGTASIRTRLGGAAIVLAPVAVFAVLHASTHAAGTSIIGSSGAVTRPSAETLGVTFVVLGLAGAALATRIAPARPLLVLLAVTALQGLALAAFDFRSGARSFYMPFKMVYLAALPCAVFGALALAGAGDALASRGRAVRVLVAVAPLVIASLLASGRFPVKRQHGPLSESALAAGTWARDSLPPGCIDYFSRHWLTGYWLHLDVLGNPRLSDRMREETFEFRDTVGKWIDGKGLPYGIVEDFSAIPRDARVDMIPLRRFGPSAVVQNARPRPASGSDPNSILCRGK